MSDRRVHLPGVLGGDDSPAEDIRASESIDLLVQLLTSRAGLDADMAERCMFDLRNALDELDRLRRVVAAVAEIRGCLGAGPMGYELFVDELDEILAGTSERIEVTR